MNAQSVIFKKVKGFVCYDHIYDGVNFEALLLFRCFKVTDNQCVVYVTGDAWKLTIWEEDGHNVFLGDDDNAEYLRFEFAASADAEYFHNQLCTFLFSMEITKEIDCCGTNNSCNHLATECLIDVEHRAELFVNLARPKPTNVPIEDYVPSKSEAKMNIYQQPATT